MEAQQKLITVVAYRRPLYLQKCLEALATCDGIDSWNVVMSIDGGSEKNGGACVELACAFAERHPTNRIVMNRDINHGINWHGRAVVDTALKIFNRTQLIVAIEEDAALSPDALFLAEEFCLQGRGKYDLISLGKSSDWSQKDLAEPYALEESTVLDTAWAYAFTRKAWEQQLSVPWNAKIVEPFGWDWSMSYELWSRKAKTLRPVLSRVKNIGRDGGVNAYPAWFDENMPVAKQVASDFHAAYDTTFYVKRPVFSGAEGAAPWIRAEFEARKLENKQGFRAGGSVLRDDWFLFFFDHDHSKCPVTDACEPRRTENHELCSLKQCSYRRGPCEFHPVGCDCSNGACQDEER